MYERDEAARSLGIRVEEMGPGRSRLSMTVRPDMVNGHAICHGGFLFTLADTAFAYACNSHNGNTVAAGARIEFLAPGQLGDRLEAEALELSRQGRTGVYDVVVRNADGRKLALFRGNSFQIKGNLIDYD